MIVLLLFCLLGAVGFVLIFPADTAKWGAAAAILLQTVFLALIWDWTSDFGGGSWIVMPIGKLGALNIKWAFQLDALNKLLVALTCLLMLVAIVASWSQKERPRSYFSLLLLLNLALIGCFTAVDLVVFFLFFELMLLPMFFLIAGWGGKERQYAALKFFIFTFAGSVFLLLAIIALGFSYIDPIATGEAIGLYFDSAPDMYVLQVQKMMAAGQIPPEKLVRTFNVLWMQDAANLIPGSVLSFPEARAWAFLAVVVAFGVKLPIAPLHTWLPVVHVEASTPVSVLLAGILLKVGGYGLLRLGVGVFPDQILAWQTWLATFGVFSILYGSFNALAQSNLKRLIAYSSVAHMGFVLLGIAAFNTAGFTGAMLLMVAHGLVSAMLFLLAGVLYDRVQDYHIDHFRGLWNAMPRFTTCVVIAFFAGMGVPGFAPFVGEFLVLSGAFAAKIDGAPMPWALLAGALLGVVLAAGYFLWTFRRMFLGAFETKGGADWAAKLRDLTPRELLMLVPLALLVVALGVWPQIATEWLGGSLAGFDEHAAELAKALNLKRF